MLPKNVLRMDELRIRERAIEASSHGIAIIDISKNENKVIYVNKAFERITGLYGTTSFR